MLLVDYLKSLSEQHLIAERFVATLAAITRYLESHPTAKFIDPRRVSESAGGTKYVDLLAFLSTLVKQGKLKQVFRYRTLSNHTLSDETYDSVKEIESRLPELVPNTRERDDVAIVDLYAKVDE